MIWLCENCGIEHEDAAAPPAGDCVICADDRQWVRHGGQRWTTHAEVAARHTFELREHEPDLVEIRVTPSFGIGHTGLALRTPAGALLWEPPGLFTEELVRAITEAVGEVRAVTASHPHLVGAAVSWAETLGVPYYVAAADRRWVRRPSDAIAFWERRATPLPGLELVQTGGHFPGSAVLHWPAGADGRGVLLVGDTIAVGADRTMMSFMRSFPNSIPLPERLVRQIVRIVDSLEFDRIYGGFRGVVEKDAKTLLRTSAERYIGWLRDEIRDPDEIEL